MKNKLILIYFIVYLILIQEPIFALGIKDNVDIIDDKISQINTEISSVNHIPTVPLPDQDITISATLSSPSTSINNLTLNYIIDNSEQIRVGMDTINNIRYEKTILSQPNISNIYYWVELFIDNNLIDRKPSTGNINIEIKDTSGPRNVTIEYGRRTQLSAQNYTISDPSNSFKLQLNLNKGIELLINTTARNVLSPIEGFVQLSDLINIEVNDSTAIDTSMLYLGYEQSLIDEYGAIESKLNLLTRENSSFEWTEYNATVDSQNNFLIANITHFSDWSVASSNSILRFLSTESPKMVKVKSRRLISTIGSNVGNIRAENVSIQFFVPKGLFINNESNQLNQNYLYPLENISAVWSFFADEVGTYNVVIVINGSNAEGESIEIHFEVVDVGDLTDTQATQLPTTTQNKTIFAFSFLPLTGLFILIYKKRKIQ